MNSFPCGCPDRIILFDPRYHIQFLTKLRNFILKGSDLISVASFRLCRDSRLSISQGEGTGEEKTPKKFCVVGFLFPNLVVRATSYMLFGTLV